jgi:hypothetical protein
MKVLLPVFALLLLAACSRHPDVTGAWKNTMGNMITFKDDGVALLGQEGLRDTQNARYEFRGDTLLVSTAHGANGEPASWNVFLLLPKVDTLQFAAVELHRPNDVSRLPGVEFARRLGCEPWAVAFTRVKEKAK